jgi:hypothetical protein
MATTPNGTECTIVSVVEGVAHVRFAFDGEAAVHQLPISSLSPKFFLPEGEPLEPVEEVELDPDEAQEDAEETWDDMDVDEEVEDLL